MYKIIEKLVKLNEEQINDLCNNFNYVFINYIIDEKENKYLYIFSYKNYANSIYNDNLPDINNENIVKYSDIYKGVDLTFEKWKPIPSYEGIYEISNMGRIKSLGNNKSRKDKILSPGRDGGGYWKYNMCKNGETFSEKVHRLVVKTFTHDIPEGYQIDHINTKINDNRISNLRIVTVKENSNNKLTKLNRKKS